jgi:hypothetical protein
MSRLGAKNTQEFRFLRAASLAHLKGPVGLILAKVLLDRITHLVICRGAVSPLIVRGFAQFMYACMMCVCMYIGMCVCMYIHTHTQTHIHTYTTTATTTTYYYICPSLLYYLRLYLHNSSTRTRTPICVSTARRDIHHRCLLENWYWDFVSSSCVCVCVYVCVCTVCASLCVYSNALPPSTSYAHTFTHMHAL